jgi:2-polyprenyl-6-methoxyphenol hydroxylase-like FAD-dependent oxidoreductase
MRKLGGHAVVLGVGIAGLFTARVLSEAYDQVTLIERDVFPPPGGTPPPVLPAAARRGVPQGRHAHALMPRGTQLLDELYPGIVRQMVADGAVLAEPLVDFRLRVNGHVLRKVPIGAPVVQASRPFLEGHVRNRVRACPAVDIIDGCDVVGLQLAAGSQRVRGVRVIRRAPGSAEEIVPADLVVDAMGRGGRTPAWLAAHGFPRPPEQEFRVAVAYASRYLRLPPDARGIEKMVGVGPVPGCPRGMMMIAVEGGRRLLTLAGFGGEHRPPVDAEGFLAFAATVAPPDVLAAIRTAEPLSDIAAHRYPCYLRRHYQRLRRFPDGLLVTGDALCSFSPIYAQGMTVAALQAAALRRCLLDGADGVARRYFRAASRAVAGPWRMAVGADLALPEVEGRRTAAVRLLNAYSRRVVAAAEHDDMAARQFMRVTGMIDAPATLLSPAVLRPAMRRSQVQAANPTDTSDMAPAGAGTSEEIHDDAARLYQ